MKVDEVRPEAIYKALNDVGIPYEVVRREDGWLEIGFCVKEFDRGAFEDWQVERVDTNDPTANYAIYHKIYNQEWEDEDGINLVFETKEEAEEYLRKEFSNAST